MSTCPSVVAAIIIIIIIIIITIIMLLLLLLLIVSITKFSIVIGPPRAYLSRNQRAITEVSNYSFPTWTFCNCIPVIGYPRDSHVTYARF